MPFTKKTNAMKKSVTKLISGCMVLAAILSGTGCEKLDNLTLDVQNPAEGGGKSDNFTR